MPETQDSRPDILRRIVRTKWEEVDLLARRSAEVWTEARAAPPARDFIRALAGGTDVSLIAEVKRRSPGAGEIRPGLDPRVLAAGYARRGARALSVLTDAAYFGGSLDDLRNVRKAVDVPLLRKDFTLVPDQVAEARAAGADAVLLIVRILDDQRLGELAEVARELGLAALVEVHDREDLERAVAAGARVIGINNRDLTTFTADLETTRSLLDAVPPGAVVVSESGIRSATDVDRLGSWGVDAVLVGESLLREPDPAEAAARLCGRPRRGRTPRPGVKICGLTRLDDARGALRAGAGFLGSILSPGFARSVDPTLARTYPGDSGVPLVAVVVDEGVERAAALAGAADASIIQLHGDESPEEVDALRRRGAWRVWKGVRVRSEADVTRGLERFGAVADGLLLEGWHPERGGGAGAAFPWEDVVSLRAAFPPGLTFVAAGGLTPDNVRAAVDALDPDVVDVSSGVEERRGVKDPAKVAAFVRNARGPRGSEGAGGGEATPGTPSTRDDP